MDGDAADDDSVDDDSVDDDSTEGARRRRRTFVQHAGHANVAGEKIDAQCNY